MNFRAEKLGLDGCYVAHLLPSHDERGSFLKIYHSVAFADFLPNFVPREMYVTHSAKQVIRGMHFQLPPFSHSKVVVCLSGSVLDVLLDLRPGPNFGNFSSVVLSGQRENAVLLPRGVAHGFFAIEDSVLIYLVDSIYNEKNDKGIRWDSFGFAWPTLNPVVSERDQLHSDLKNFIAPKNWDEDYSS